MAHCTTSSLSFSDLFTLKSDRSLVLAVDIDISVSLLGEFAFVMSLWVNPKNSFEWQFPLNNLTFSDFHNIKTLYEPCR